MNSIKKMLASALVVVMAISVIGCHKKNEVAVTIGDFEFTSAYYMCALINADSEAKSKINEGLTDEEKNAEIDYYSKKVEDKDFVTWVEDTAIENLKKIAAQKTLCKKAEIEVSEEDISNAETTASNYWQSGYSSYFEPNGVSLATYKKYMTDSCYAESYFEHLYKEGGEKAVDAETVKNAIYDNFVIADSISVSFSNLDETQIASAKEQFNTYLTALTEKTKTFEEVYVAQNGPSQEDETTETEEAKPLDKYAGVFGAKDTAYESDLYDTIKAMEIGEVKLIEQENNAGLVLAVKQDIKADPYYTANENLDLATRHFLKKDEFDEYIIEYMKDLKCDINEYAVKQFKVKNIKQPELQQ